MKELLVAETSELQDGSRIVVSIESMEIGLYRHKGKLYAYRNFCAHQGGPACEGLMMPQVQEVLGPDRTYRQLTFNHERWHIVCPWHGWEYELETGEMVADRKFRLHKYPVIERDGKIYVQV